MCQVYKKVWYCVLCPGVMSQGVILCVRCTRRGDAVYCVGFMMSKGVILCKRCSNKGGTVYCVFGS